MEMETEPGAADGQQRKLVLGVLRAHHRRQHGLVSRQQVLAAGGTDGDIARMVRRREWKPVVEGVYANHTGPLSWDERAWAAVLFCAPAALAGRSALRAFGVRGQASRDDVIAVAVGLERRLQTPDWIDLVRMKDFESRIQGNLSPPRVRMDEALLQSAAMAGDEAAAMALLGDAVQRGHTTAARLVELLRRRNRLPRRRALLVILDDVAQGAYSVLERRYLRDVERPHGLPTARRQRRARPGKTVGYRDVEYLDMRLVVELDGRLGHDTSADRWADLDRDLASMVAGDLTVRVGWKQVLEPCRLATGIASLLAARGWPGAVLPCSEDCPARDSGESHSSGEGDSPLSA